MAKRERLIKNIQTEDGSIIEVKIDYRIGGMNYFTGSTVERGLHLSVSPVRVSKSSCGTYSTRSYTAFTGLHHLVKPLSRYNAKVLNEFPIDDDVVNLMVSRVVNKNNLKIVE